MPYRKRHELPDSVIDALPVHAQDIYLSAYNNAWERYKRKTDRQLDETREATAHKVAWSAVKIKYEKINGKWQIR